MKRRTLTIEIVSVGLLTAALHYRAIAEAWYWQFWWADVVMHFLGGLFVGLIVLWLSSRFLHDYFINPSMIVVTIASIFVVSISWEVFEYVAGVSFIEGYALDTTLDLVMGVLGSVAALIYVRSVVQTWYY